MVRCGTQERSRSSHGRKERTEVMGARRRGRMGSRGCVSGGPHPEKCGPLVCLSLSPAASGPCGASEAFQTPIHP